MVNKSYKKDSNLKIYNRNDILHTVLYIRIYIFPASCEKVPSDSFDAPSRNTGKRQRSERRQTFCVAGCNCQSVKTYIYPFISCNVD